LDYRLLSTKGSRKHIIRVSKRGEAPLLKTFPLMIGRYIPIMERGIKGAR